MSSTRGCRLLALLLLAGCAADPEQIGEESAAIDVCGGSIQDAIDAAPPGAVLDICAGTYNERLVIDGKALTLRGTSGAGSTIIDAGGLGPVLVVRNTPSPGVAVRGLTLRNGMSGTAGGGLRCTDSALMINASVLVDNEGNGGGGLYANACSLAVVGTRMSNNDAGGQPGGGAWIVDSSGEIRTTRFLGNSAESGGGIALTGGTLVVRNSVIRNNAAAVRGGGVYTASNAAITAATIADNTSDWTGGGVYIFRTAPTISNSTISTNTSVNDGGGFYLHRSNARLLDNTIAGNLGQDDGGGIRVFESRARLERNIIENNNAGDGGGGIRLSHLRSVMIDNIVRNNSSGTIGGGIELDNDSTLVRGGLVEGNTSGTGGGIAISLAPYNGCRIESVEIRDNEADEGGGLWVANNYVTVTMRNLTIEANRAGRGAGLDIRGTNFELHHSVFDGNIATDAGGAIAHHPRGPCDLEQCPPTDPVGAIDFIVAYRNDAPFGSVLWTNKEGLSIENSIMFSNIGVGVDLDGGIAEPTWRYNDMRPASFDDMADPTGTNGNIALDPLFVDASAGNFRLAAGSPARDAADPALTDSDGTRADMGRYGGL